MAVWQDKIEGANATWMKNYAEGNSAGVGDMYTEDCRVMPPGADVVVGRKGMQLVDQLTHSLPHLPSSQGPVKYLQEP